MLPLLTTPKVHCTIPMNVANVIAPLTTVYWITALFAALCKLCSSRVDALLRYGVRRHHDVVSISSFTLSVLFDSSHGIASHKCWKLFYATGVMSSLLCILVSRNCLPLLLFIAHTTRRLAECMYLHNFSSTCISLAHVCMGASFYVFAAPTLTLYIPVENNSNIPYLPILIFITAQLVQHNAHRALASTVPLVGKYGLPHGFGFGTVACPHYTAEIVIYAVLLCVAPSIPCALLFVFVLINLSHSATQTVDWYQRTFSKHHASKEIRYALIKWVF